MDRKYISDNHIVERYLADKLSDEERTAFEAYYLQHPEVVQEMELVARMKVGFAKLASDGELDALVAAQKPRSSSWLRVAAAAAAIFVAVALVVQFADRPSPTLLGRTAAEVSAGLSSVLQASAPYTIVRRRDANDGTIDLPSEPQAILLRLDLANVEPSQTYRVTLRKPDGGEVIGTVEGLQAAGGSVQVFMNSALLTPGVYDVIVSGNEQPEEDGVAYRLSLEN